MESENAGKLEQQICFLLYAASRIVMRHYRPYLEPLGLTYTQYIILMLFRERTQSTVKELGIRLYLDSGTLTPVLKSLEARGLVRRSRDVNDERVVQVQITDNGKEMLSNINVFLPVLDAENVLSRDETHTLQTLLIQIMDQDHNRKDEMQ